LDARIGRFLHYIGKINLLLIIKKSVVYLFAICFIIKAFKTGIIMKYIFVLLFSLMILQPSGTAAQVRLGIKAGVNISHLSISGGLPYHVTNNVGFTMGPTVLVLLPLKGLAVETGAMFDHQSVEVESVGLLGGKICESVIRQQQIIVPVSLSYGIDLTNNSTLSFFAGPQVGFRLGKKVTGTDYAEWVAKSAMLSVNAGVSVMITRHVLLSAAYNIACSKSGEFWINRHVKGGGQCVGSAKFHTAKLSAAYFF
jgi:hypothetical protein